MIELFTMYFFSLYWIPIEFYNTIELARKSPQADIWAFSTTLWELFNYGIVLPEVLNVELFKKVNICYSYYYRILTCPLN